MIKNIFLVTTKIEEESILFKELLEHIKFHYKIECKVVHYNQLITDYTESSIAILYIGDAEIKHFIKNHLDSDLRIGILPLQSNQKAQISYGISTDVHEALDDIINSTTTSKVDLLLCNNEPVFTNIIIGDVLELNSTKLDELSIIDKIKSLIKNIKNLEFKEFTLTTAKDQSVSTAATGIMILEHNSKKIKNNLIDDDLSLHDGQLNAFVLAPKSILSYIYYIFIMFFYNRFTISTLPKSIGIIKTSKLYIRSSKAIDYKIDGSMLSSKSLELEVKKDGINIILGKEIQNTHNSILNQALDDKESIKVQYLPKGDTKISLLSQKLPFFKNADEEDFKELFLSLKESAKFSSIFFVLMVLSTLLATTGLFQSSAPVIIGAMILAPLMSPIVSLAMGVVRADTSMLKSSSITLWLGIATAILVSCIYTYFMPLSSITSEIQSRLNPNILDLMVAIISGIAGAYANSKSEVAKSLAGVAIAVALVPPLSVTGIGIGWGNIDVIYGSFLLFVTNLVGITLAASLTFIILGYAPVTRAKKGLLYTTIIMSIVTIPLFASFTKLIEHNNILNSLKTEYIINDKKIEIIYHDIDISHKKPLLSIETNSNDILNKDDLKILKKKIAKSIDKDILLKVRSNIIVQ
jgi:uncharacterized hydrophobic protein (TIGR00271 family)